MSGELIGNIILGFFFGVAWGYVHVKSRVNRNWIVGLEADLYMQSAMIEFLLSDTRRLWQIDKRLRCLETECKGFTVKTESGYAVVYESPTDVKEPIEGCDYEC